MICTSMAFGTGSAFAGEPWWHLGSGARPAFLRGGSAVDEVQSVAVSASEGEFGLRDQETGGLAVAVYNEEAGELQVQLEGVFGVGNVVVTRGPVGHPAVVNGSEAYVVSFGGGLSDEPVGVMGTVAALGGGSVLASQVRQGAPDGEVLATAENLGDASVLAAGCAHVGLGVGRFTTSECSEGSARGLGEWEKTPVRISDVLPPGLRVVAVAGATPTANTSPPIGCRVISGVQVECELETSLVQYGFIEVRVAVVVEAAAPEHSVDESLVNEVSVEGGQTASATIRRPERVSSEAIPFGVEDYELVNEEEGGVVDEQAGSHPFQTTLTLNLNQTADGNPPPSIADNGRPLAHPVALARSLHFKWPPGLIGNPLAVARCSVGLFLQVVEEENRCPADTAVGVARVSVFEAVTGVLNVTAPLFDLEPEKGEPARFGFTVLGVPVLIDVSVRSGEDYGITVQANNIPQTIEFLSSSTTVWGDPGAPAHSSVRGYRCFTQTVLLGVEGCEEPVEAHPPPFTVLPTACSGAVASLVEGDSWTQADEQEASGQAPSLSLLASTTMPALDGCNRLPFAPQIRAVPDTSAASSSSGMTVDVHVPQEESINPQGLAEGYPRNIVVTLPEGVAVNPSGGDGLAGCSEGLAGFLGSGELETIPHTQTLLFKPLLAGSPASGETLLPGVNFCPNASKIATAKIKTPLLANPIEGAVYLASQNENPFGSLLAMYIIAEDPVSGVLIRIAGQVHLGESGQVTATFENSPQAPFEDAELHFFGGERAPLATPPRCGSYTTAAQMTPWSGTPPVSAASTFDITSGPDGSGCPGSSLAFSPILTGGSVNNNAGALTALSTTIAREDGQQNMQSVKLVLPAGLSGLLWNVKLCPEEQANNGTCGPESLIGETTVSAGVGSDPVSVTGGKVYITEKYAGAPFGLSIVNPVKAGPFDLEHDTSNPAQQPACDCLVVRAKLEVNPTTAALTVTTDPAGPHAIPHIIDGIPVQIRKVNVTITRPDFTFNPTSCDPLAITANITSTTQTNVPLTIPFQVANCAILKFAPAFSVSTGAHTSKANGASLTAKIVYPKGSFGTEANVASVKVELPEQLPSRLTTLQKACTAKVFEENPEKCPVASKIGFAKSITPLLPVPVEGPAYFVSHGGEAFPSLIIVLKGYGVTVDVVGTTFISKKGITSTTFKTVPDVPFNSFELTLHNGPFSALTANVPNLCNVKSKLIMPTDFKAQNGDELKQSTKISVTGCKAKKAGKKHKKKAKGKKKK